MINVTKAELPLLKTYYQYLKKIWKSAWLTNNGEFVQRLEKELKKFLHIKYISLLTNGTLALQLAIRAFDLKGEIITTPFTFAATSTSILWEGCTPVFSDIDENTYNIDPLDVEDKITKKTSAILAVHVYGNPCDVEKLNMIANKYHLKLIYDAAHAFAVEYKDNSILTYGDLSTLSFHATKMFNTIEGGALVSNNKNIIDKINIMRNFGIISEENVTLPGINAKMNEFQAAMGLCNLNNLKAKIKIRQRIYEFYKKNLNNNRIKFQKLTASNYNYGYMPIRLDSKMIRDKIFFLLIKNGIKPRKYFYPLITDLDFLKIKKLNSKYNIVKAKQISDGILCLPIYSTLSIGNVKKVIDIINSYF